MRRTFRRRFGARRKIRTQWVTQYFGTTGPFTNPMYLDLLNDWRVQQGILINPPDTVLWRSHIKVSVSYSAAMLTGGTGIHVSMFNEDIAPAPILNPTSQGYDERWLIYDTLYLSQEIMEGGVVTTAVAFHEYDVKARRKLQNQNETFYLALTGVGQFTAYNSISITSRLLLKLP